MHPVSQGILWGLFLTILVGPILFTLIQTGIERGFRAGMLVGLGIWLSDLLFIVLAYWSMQHISDLIEWSGFELWLGLLGGMVLIAIGGYTIQTKPPGFREVRVPRTRSVVSLLSKGILINGLNPFTIFFWVTITGAVVVDEQMSLLDTRWFYGSILGTVVITDTIKVALAKLLRKKLRPKNVAWVRRISGFALILFGVILIFRVTL